MASRSDGVASPRERKIDMRWNVHIKNELGRDDNVVVEAESEIAAERVAASQRNDVAVVMGAYPAGEDENSVSTTDGHAEQDYAAAGDRLEAARNALVGARGQGQEALDRAGAEYTAAAAAWTAERAAVEDQFGPHYGREIPEAEADETGASEPPPEIWEQWEREAAERTSADVYAAQGRTVDTAPAQMAAPADGDRVRRSRPAASESRVTYVDVSRPKDEGERLNDQVGRAHEALTQLAAAVDPPSTGWGHGASTSNDDDVRER